MNASWLLACHDAVIWRQCRRVRLADLDVFCVARRLLGSMRRPSENVRMIQVIIEYSGVHLSDRTAIWPQEPLPHVVHLQRSEI